MQKIIAYHLLVSMFFSSVYAQTTDIQKTSEVEEFRLRNKSNGYSFLIGQLSDDSLQYYKSQPFVSATTPKKWTFGMYAPELRIQYNTTAPFSWNDGPMIPNRGGQVFARYGLLLKKGIVHMQLRPEFVHAESRPVPGFSPAYDDKLWAERYKWFNAIDNPENWNKPYTALFPGQSFIKIRLKKLSAGVSTENMWWGPGRKNSLLMTNNAPGFPRLFIQTEKPLKSKLGRFEFQFIAGRLTASDQLPPDTGRTYQGNRLYIPKPALGQRYINGLAVAYQPSFIKGLSIGLGRVIYQYTSERQHTFDGYLPVFGFLFKNKLPGEDDKKRDQLLSIFIKQAFQDGKTEFYLEFGRNDHAWNLRDLLQNPSHSRAFVAGMTQRFDWSGRKALLNLELTDLSRSSQVNLRPTPNWYTHHQVVHGYTHQGQVIGAGIGPGSGMQSATLDIMKNLFDGWGFGIHRIARNKDFFYDAFSGAGNQFSRKWVDIALEGKWSRSFRKVNVITNIFVIRSLSYQYRDLPGNAQATPSVRNDLMNLSLNLTFQYKLMTKS